MSKQDALSDLGLATSAPEIRWLALLARAYVDHREAFWWTVFGVGCGIILALIHASGMLAPLHQPFGMSTYALLAIYATLLYRRLGAEIDSHSLKISLTLLVIIPVQFEYLGGNGGVIGRFTQHGFGLLLSVTGTGSDAAQFVGLILSSALTIYALVLGGFPLVAAGLWLWNWVLSLMLAKGEAPALTSTASRRTVKTVAPVAPVAGTALTKILESHGVAGAVEVGKKQGPVITRHLLRIPAGQKLSKLSADDISRDMHMSEGQWVAITPNAGGGLMGIDVPNPTRETINFARLLKSSEWADLVKAAALPVLLGVGVDGKPMGIDLAKLPHLLVAGTTGGGKSGLINVIILSLLSARPAPYVNLVLIDPKRIEFGLYANSSYLAQPVITVMDEAASALQWTLDEMNRREMLFAAVGVKNIAGYNAKAVPDERKPYLVIVIDEFSALMISHRKHVETAVAGLAQEARAVGIHLILATQHPTVDVVTSLIKANIPARFALLTASGTDSRTVLDENGAEKLLGLGDGLLKRPGSAITRIHGAFIPDDEIEQWVK